jgi:hypothetical protein
MFIVKVCHTIINNYYVEGRSHHTQIGREQLINEFDLDRQNKVDVALLVWLASFLLIFACWVRKSLCAIETTTE